MIVQCVIVDDSTKHYGWHQGYKVLHKHFKWFKKKKPSFSILLQSQTTLFAIMDKF